MTLAPPGVATDTTTDTALDRALAPGAIRSAYQPIVDLASGAVVAYEALARPGADTGFARPDVLIDAARRAGRLDEVDAACRRAALDGATGRMDGSLALFVNVEPEALGSNLPLFPTVDRTGGPRPRLVLEVTERAITSRPADLVAELDRARRRGFAIAVDDVGADPASLALLSVIAPDVIKLDLSLIQGRPTPDTARIHSAVSAEAERSGATILAEGIETPAHLAQAMALGATLGQGYLFGRPGPIGPGRAEVPWVPQTAPPTAGPGRTPFDVVAPHREVRIATKATLIATSKLMEDQAWRLDPPGICLSAFQEARNLTPATIERYGSLVSACSLVAAFGAELDATAVPGLRHGRLGHGDPLRGEWSVVVIGSHHAAALVARDLGDPGPDAGRRFEHAITHDRQLALEAARTLLARIDPLDRPRP